jgi:hypothetical protein
MMMPTKIRDNGARESAASPMRSERLVWGTGYARMGRATGVSSDADLALAPGEGSNLSRAALAMQELLDWNALSWSRCGIAGGVSRPVHGADCRSFSRPSPNQANPTPNLADLVQSTGSNEIQQ